MKKVITLILCFACLLAVVSCGPGGTNDGGEKENFKIGVIFYSKDDALGQLVYS